MKDEVNLNSRSWDYIVINTRKGSQRLLLDKEDLAIAYDIADSWGLFKDKQGRPLARSGKKSGQVFFHRLLVDIPKGSRLEWKNGNTLDCRKANLQLVDKDGNVTEVAPPKDPAEYERVSIIKGVYFHKHKKLWTANPFWNGKRYSLCYYPDTLEGLRECEDQVEIFRNEGPNSPKLKRNQKRKGIK